MCDDRTVFSRKSFTRNESTNRFRFFYHRSDFPCSIEHRSSGHRLKWFFDQLDVLNLDFYLPLFAEGLRETKFPFSFIAFRGFLDLVENGSHRIDAEILSKLVKPLKRALSTFDPSTINRVLVALQTLSRGNDASLGVVLLPYLKHFLPLIYAVRQRFLAKDRRNSFDCRTIDQFHRNELNDLVRLIDQTLLVLEKNGGPDAFLVIKHSVPIYEQQIDFEHLSPNQIKAIVRPIDEFQSNID